MKKQLRALALLVPLLVLVIAVAFPIVTDVQAAPVVNLEDTATVTVSSQYSGGYAGSYAVDNNTGTEWASSNESANAWIKLTWGAAQTISEIRVMPRSSDSWGFLKIVTAENETYNFCFTPPLGTWSTLHLQNSITTSSITITGARAAAGNNTGFKEIEVNDSISATATPTSTSYTDLSCADSFLSSSNASGFAPINVVDGSVGNSGPTAWASDGDGANSWIQFGWNTAVTVREIRIHGRTSEEWGVPRFTFSSGYSENGAGAVSQTDYTTYILAEPIATLSLMISVASGGTNVNRGLTEILVLGDFGGETVPVENRKIATFTTSWDNWLNSNNPTTNYGSADHFYAGDASSGGSVASSRGIIRFAFDTIPPNADVIRATLTLTTGADSLCSGNRNIDAYLVKSEWSETESNWTTRLIEWDSGLGSYVTRPWSAVGAGSTEQVQPSNSSVFVNSSSTAPVNFDVTTDVRKIVRGDNFNYGWVLQDRTEAEGCIRSFYAFDNPTSNYRPRLVVEYVVNDYTLDASWLEDGSYEDGSSAWEYAGGATRRQNELEFSSNNVGPAYCGDYYATIDGGFNEATNQPTAVTQRFYWPGGIAFFHTFLHINNNDLHAFEAKIKLIRVDGTQPDVSVYSQPSYGMAANTWFDVNQSFPLGAGFYDLAIGSTDAGGMNISDFAIDDITIALNQYMSHCLGPGGPTRTPRPTYTMTPTASRTPTGTAGASPTPTNTPSVSPTPSNTPTPARANNFGNCDFEGGSAGWTGSNWSLGNAGGPIGPRYAIINGTVSQQFPWPGGVAYFTFWIGPGSYGSVSVRNLTTNQSTTLHTPASPAAWQLRTASANLATGTYRVEASGNGNTIKIDGVMVAANGFAYCGSASGPITPTGGPTSYVTATSTPTPNASLSPTPSATATASKTPTKTMTPFPTNTPGPTNTPIPTHTQVPTDTQIPSNTPSGAEQTATAQGTDIPTYTPYPTLTPYPTFTPYPTATPYTPPPEQPPPAWNADCKKPEGLDPAAWAGYYQCQALSWFSWSPGNTQQIMDFLNSSRDQEPFGSIVELQSTLTDMNGIINSYDWSRTGRGVGPADPNVWLSPRRSIYAGDEMTFSDATNYSLDVCDLQIPGAGGWFLKGVCWGLAFMEYWGFLSWIEWSMNIVAIFMLILYILNKWVSKAST